MQTFLSSCARKAGSFPQSKVVLKEVEEQQMPPQGTSCTGPGRRRCSLGTRSSRCRPCRRGCSASSGSQTPGHLAERSSSPCRRRKQAGQGKICWCSSVSAPCSPDRRTGTRSSEGRGSSSRPREVPAPDHRVHCQLPIIESTELSARPGSQESGGGEVEAQPPSSN